VPILLMLLGCLKVAPDPPVQPMHALPVVGASDASFADELIAFEAIRAAYVGLGWGEAADVQLTMTSAAVMPYSSGGDVFVPPFRSPSFQQAHLSAVSSAFYGGRLDDYATRFPSELQAARAYDAFMVMMLLHEIAHAVAYRRGVDRTVDNPFYEELRAIYAEQAIAHHLVDRGQLPSETLDDYDAFNQVLLAAAPTGFEVPTGDELGTQFNTHYPQMLGALDQAVATGENPAQASTDYVLAIYSHERVALHRAPPAIADLTDRFDLTLVQALRQMLDPATTVEQDGDELVFELGAVSWRVRVSSSGDVYYTGRFGARVPSDRRAAVLELANSLADHHRVGRFQLTTDDQLELYHYGRRPTPHDAQWLLEQGQKAIEAQLPGFEAAMEEAP
jgi:hypothetical protein